MCAESYPRTTLARTEFDQTIFVQGTQTLHSGTTPTIDEIIGLPAKIHQFFFFSTQSLEGASLSAKITKNKTH